VENALMAVNSRVAARFGTAFLSIYRGRPMRESTVQLGGSLAGKLSSRLSSMSLSDSAGGLTSSCDGCATVKSARSGSGLSLRRIATSAP
jgi:hypothetical protein